jgi:hypothetical protein
VPDADEDGLFDAALGLARDRLARLAQGARGQARARAAYDIRAIVPALAAAYRGLLAPAGAAAPADGRSAENPRGRIGAS